MSACGDLLFALLSGAFGLILQLRLFDGVAFGVVVKRLLIILSVFKCLTQSKLKVDPVLAAEMRILIIRTSVSDSICDAKSAILWDRAGVSLPYLFTS